MWLKGQPSGRTCGIPLRKGDCPQPVVRDANGNLRTHCFWHQKIADGLAQPLSWLADEVYGALRIPRPTLTNRAPVPTMSVTGR